MGLLTTRGRLRRDFGDGSAHARQDFGVAYALHVRRGLPHDGSSLPKSVDLSVRECSDSSSRARAPGGVTFVTARYTAKGTPHRRMTFENAKRPPPVRMTSGRQPLALELEVIDAVSGAIEA